MAFKDVHILAGIFSSYILYDKGKSPLLMRNNQVNFGDIMPETSKSSAFWDVGVNSNLKWLPLFSPDEAGESDGTSLWPAGQFYFIESRRPYTRHYVTATSECVCQHGPGADVSKCELLLFTRHAELFVVS